MHPRGCSRIYCHLPSRLRARNLWPPLDEDLTRTSAIGQGVTLIPLSLLLFTILWLFWLEGSILNCKGEHMLIILIVLLLVFGFGGYRMGPGLGYYGGGGISLILLIVIILLLLKVI